MLEEFLSTVSKPEVFGGLLSIGGGVYAGKNAHSIPKAGLSGGAAILYNLITIFPLSLLLFAANNYSLVSSLALGYSLGGEN